MAMKPGLRKLALTMHVVTSVGSLGAVAGFVALALAGLIGRDDGVGRVVYGAMDLITWSVIVPVILASLVTGIISSLGTPWGLFRHYWIIVKLVLTMLAAVVLLFQLRPIHLMAEAAAVGRMAGSDIDALRIQLVVHATGGLLVLLIATVLSVYKPRGVTGYGARRLSEQRALLPQ
jgi:hypothetical protein